METKLYVLIIAVFASVPLILDIIFAYLSQYITRNTLIKKAAEDKKFELDELKQFIKECRNSPPGIAGLARSTMALTVILILGIAVFHIIVKDRNGGSQVVNNVLSMLAGLLAAITGFYFGGKTAEKKSEEGDK